MSITKANGWLSNFLGTKGGPTRKEDEIKHSRFSEFFPWIAYNKEEQLYCLRDNSVCWMFECDPMVLATPLTYEIISNLYKINFPESTILQFVLYADPHIKTILDNFEYLRIHNQNINPIFLGQAKNYREFMNAAKYGLKNFQGTPVKDYKLYFSIRIPIDADFSTAQDDWFNESLKHTNLISNAVEKLKSAGIRSVYLDPDTLINTMFRIMNPDLTYENLVWDESLPINKQIIYADTDIKVDGSYLKIGSKYSTCLTPKTIKKNVEWTLVKNLIGYCNSGATSSDDDMNQIMVPHIYTLSIIIEDTSSTLNNKALLSFAQKSKGTSAVNVNSRKSETYWLLEQQEQGEKIIKIIPQLTLFHDNKKSLEEEVNHVKALWEQLQCPLQQEAKYLIKKMFVSSFPGGLFGDDYDATQRVHLVPTLTAGYLSPVQAGFKGIGTPQMLLLDRRAQLAALDILETAENKNFLITGGTGGGKSFFCNYMVGSYLATGAKVRIIDVGRSYEKLCKKVGGQFIVFANSDLIINFFETVEKLDEDTLPMLVSILITMAYSRTGTIAQESEMAIMELAITSVFSKKGKSTTIDDIADYLMHLDRHFDTSSNPDKFKILIQSGASLAIALEKYTSRGAYGKYFYGKSTVSFTKDFVTVELDGTSEELRRVMVLAFSMMIENEIYNGDRKRPTIVLLDEAWQTLDNPVAGKFAEGLYRKARKYFASIGICIQSAIDAAPGGRLGSIGTVAKGQSAFHFALPDDGLDAARDEKVINVDDYTFYNTYKNMPTNSKPNYSEFTLSISNKTYIPLRLVVDSYSYFLYTSDPKDNNALSELEDVIKEKRNNLSDEQIGAMAIDIAASYSNKNNISAFRKNIKQIVQEVRNAA